MASSNVSAVTSHFSNANEGFITTLSSSILSGAATVPLTGVSGLTNGDVFVGLIEPGQAKEQAFTGIVDTSGTQITSVVWTKNPNSAHSAGVTIVDYVTGTAHNMMKKGILVGHNQDGTHATSLPLTTPKITTSINDSAGNEVIKTPATASATNEITVTNAANGSAPKISASGSSDSNVALNLQGKGTGSVQINGIDILQGYDYIVSGLVITADSAGVNRNYSITLGVVCIGGNFLTVAAVSAQTVGASKDRYVDLRDNGDGTAVYVTNEVNNNAASQALTAGDLRIGIVVAGAGSIANAAAINQGQPEKILPIASSIPYAVTDSLGNLIGNRTAYPVVIGLRQILTTFATASATAVQVTGLTVPVIIPTGRKVKLTFSGGHIVATGGTINPVISIWDGTVASGTEVAGATSFISASGGQAALITDGVLQPSLTGASTKTYNAGVLTNANTVTLTGTATHPITLKAELV